MPLRPVALARSVAGGGFGPLLVTAVAVTGQMALYRCDMPTHSTSWRMISTGATPPPCCHTCRQKYNNCTPLQVEAAERS